MFLRCPLEHLTVGQLELQGGAVHHHLDFDHRVLKSLVLFLVGPVVDDHHLVVLVVVEEKGAHLKRSGTNGRRVLIEK